MRKLAIAAIALTALVTAPAMAIGLDDLAKTILGGNSVLKKSEEKCGDKAKLTKSENSILSSAVSAVRQSISPDQFTAFDQIARANAETESTGSEFCPETKKKKKGLLSKIGKAAKGILKAKSLGL
jgi:hypothetical protein